MNFWLWVIVTLCLQINFGLVWGWVLTILAMVISRFFVAPKEAKIKITKEIQENNILVSIESVVHKGDVMLLVYNAVTKKFVLQGTTIDEIVEALKLKFEDKNIFVDTGDNNMKPLYLVPELRDKV